MAWCPRDHQYVPQTTCLALVFHKGMHHYLFTMTCVIYIVYTLKNLMSMPHKKLQRKITLASVCMQLSGQQGSRSGLQNCASIV